MNSNHDKPFGTWAKKYRKLGCWPRPINMGGKACKEKFWQLPDHEQPPKVLKEWVETKANHGIGLLMGSPIGDGTLLGALDIDHDLYVPIARVLLGEIPPCGRFGSKGAVFFVRFEPGIKSTGFSVKGKFSDYGQVAELLFEKKLCVIPPSIHPNTNNPYVWLGTPLHEMDLTKLPLVKA